MNTKQSWSSDRNHHVVVRLDFETGLVDAYEKHQADNGTPERQWHGHARTWKLPAGAFSSDALEAFAEETEALRAEIVASYTSEWNGHNHVASVDPDLVEKFEAAVEGLEVTPVWELSEWLEPTVSSRRIPLISIDGCPTRVHAAYADTPRGKRRIRALVREIEALVEAADETVEGDAEKYVMRLVEQRR
jgi:hypothetical protein